MCVRLKIVRTVFTSSTEHSLVWYRPLMSPPVSTTLPLRTLSASPVGSLTRCHHIKNRMTDCKNTTTLQRNQVNMDAVCCLLLRLGEELYNGKDVSDALRSREEASFPNGVFEQTCVISDSLSSRVSSSTSCNRCSDNIGHVLSSIGLNAIMQEGVQKLLKSQ